MANLIEGGGVTVGRPKRNTSVLAGGDVVKAPSYTAPSTVPPAPPPTNPYKPPAPPAPPVDSTPTPGSVAAPQIGADQTQQLIDAAIAQIESQTGMTQAQLLADESDIGRQYRLLVMQQKRAGEEAKRQLEGAAVDRGILQSGIYAEDQAKLQASQAEAISGLEAEKAYKLAEIKRQQAQVPVDHAAAIAQAVQAAAAAGLDLDLIKAAAGL